MVAANKQRRRAHVVALAAGSILASAAMHASAATQVYFDLNGTTAGIGALTDGSTYNWDSTTWQNGSSSGTTIGNWVNDGTGFARFYQPAGTTVINATITLSNTEKMVGMLLNRGSISLNFTASGSGNFNITANTPSPLQGFLVGLTSPGLAADSLNFYAPLTGAGGIIQQQSGQISLYGNNTFSGGFGTTGGQVTNYNNANSFGSGSIQFSGTASSVQGIVKSGTPALTIPNDVYFEPLNKDLVQQANWLPNTGINLVTNGSAGAPGTTWSGNWHLPITQTYTVPGTTPVTYNTTGEATIQLGTSGSYSQISGVISGDSNTILDIGSSTAAQNANPNTGHLVLSGANTFTGKTVIFGGNVVLGAANTLASNPELHLEGGTLDAGSYVHTMSSTSLILFDLSSSGTVATIKTDSGGQIQFSESTNLFDWGGVKTLNVIGALGSLRFGTDVNGLRSDQLAQIEFNSDPASLGSGYLTSDGYLVPEPSCALLFIGAPWLLRRRRRHV
jgi:autotransporter-associated beta strand protein